MGELVKRSKSQRLKRRRSVRSRKTNFRDAIARKTKVLVIGGSSNLDRRFSIPSVELERIECDIVGLLGHSESKPFYSYDVVVYWPNEHLFALPDTYAEWQAARQRAPSLPDLHPMMWDSVSQTESTVYWNTEGSTVEIDSAPQSARERSAILRNLQSVCVERLRREIISGTHQELVLIGIISSLAADKVRKAFEWISRCIDISWTHSEPYVTKNVPDDAGITLRLLWKHLTELLPERVGLEIGIGPFATRGLDEMLHEQEGCWGNHWFEEYAPDGPLELEDCPVQVLYPLKNGAGRAKAVLFRPLAGESRTPSTGFILMIPEPQHWQNFLDLIADARKSAHFADEPVHHDAPATIEQYGRSQGARKQNGEAHYATQLEEIRKAARDGVRDAIPKVLDAARKTHHAVEHSVTNHSAQGFKTASNIEVSSDGDKVIINGSSRTLSRKQQRILSHFQKHPRSLCIREVCLALKYKAGVNCKMSAIFRERELRDALFVRVDGKETYRLRADVTFLET